MLSIEPFRPEHLQDLPISGFPVDCWRNKAASAVKDGKCIGICGTFLEDGVITVGMKLSPEMKRHGIVLTRWVVKGMRGFASQGFRKMRAQAEDETAAHWLKRLGFVQEGDWFVKCLQTP